MDLLLNSVANKEIVLKTSYAETFNPPSAIQRIDSSFLPPTVATGTDIGVRGTFLSGRFNFTVLHYDNREQNATAGSTGVGDHARETVANVFSYKTRGVSLTTTFRL